MIFADYLSRVQPSSGNTIELEHTIHGIIENSDTMMKLRIYTNKDQVLRSLIQVIMSGWPDRYSSLPTCLKPYWSIRDCLNIEDGLVFYGNRLVVPIALRQQYLEKIHSTHQGEVKRVNRAKQSVYWPGLNKYVINMVKELCQRFQRSQSREPMFESSVATQPWEAVHTDIFTLKDRTYVIVADEFTVFSV